jgi:DNA-binding transcriptional LysR family regulator
MDKLKGIQTFIAIADHGSLTAASHYLDVSLPTVVRTLAELERLLGISLFNRTTRRINLTSDGKRYLDICRAVLGELEEGEKSLSESRTRPTGRLVVTSSVLFGRMHVAPLLVEFLKRHPNVSTDLILLDRVVDLVEEGIDVGIRIGQLPDSSLHAVTVGKVRRVVCASPAYLKRRGVPKQLADLARHTVVHFTGLGSSKEMRFVQSGRSRDVDVSPIWTTNSIDAAINAVVEGLGVGQFLSYMVEPLVRSGQLRLLLVDFEPPSVPVTIIYPHSRFLTTKVRLFVDEAIEPLRASLNCHS